MAKLTPSRVGRLENELMVVVNTGETNESTTMAKATKRKVPPEGTTANNQDIHNNDGPQDQPKGRPNVACNALQGHKEDL